MGNLKTKGSLICGLLFFFFGHLLMTEVMAEEGQPKNLHPENLYPENLCKDGLHLICRYLDQKSVCSFLSSHPEILKTTEGRLVDRETRMSRSTTQKYSSVSKVKNLNFLKVYDGSFEIQFGDDRELQELTSLIRDNSEFSAALVRLKLSRVNRAQKRGIQPDRYFFRKNPISQKTWAAFTAQLRKTEVLELDLSSNFIGKKGLAEILRSLPPHLLKLVLRDNDLQSLTLETLASALGDSLESLQVLDLSNSYALSDELQNAPPPRLAGKWPIQAQSWSLFAEALSKTQIVKLNVSGNQIDDEILATLFKNLPATLINLDLRKNQITFNGALALAPLPTQLRKIRLSRNPISDEARELLLKFSKSHPLLLIRR